MLYLVKEDRDTEHDEYSGDKLCSLEVATVDSNHQHHDNLSSKIFNYKKLIVYPMRVF